MKIRQAMTQQGQRKAKHHQYLTEDTGNPHLEKQVAVVTALMRVSTNWRSFKRLFERNFQPPGGYQEEMFEDFDN
ncbi:hypothetical protein [Desulfobacula sp.]|uniref:hypothetical protein n=1 Tax=Desulfobacula sp. TaxID=2593537 RepID=UPI0026175EE5|nr:hypothetical protein [Desulfobacula sp.]